MKSIYSDLALYGSTNECARTVTVFFSISQVCTRVVTLLTLRLRFQKVKQGFLTPMEVSDTLPAAV